MWCQLVCYQVHLFTILRSLGSEIALLGGSRGDCFATPRVDHLLEIIAVLHFEVEQSG